MVRGREQRGSARRGPLLAALVIGLGLVAAPAIFQMFSRAPKGGDMITEFRPYMTKAEISKFQRYIREIDAADAESGKRLPPLMQQRLGLDAAAVHQRYPGYAAFNQRWKVINADMGDMLATMHGDIDNFEAVDALPPFPLFPWFFVVPGLLVAGFAAWGLVQTRRGRSGRGARIAVIVLGLGVVAAPAMFQMFTRAPKGAEMIDDFRPFMTTKKVRTIQGYFRTIGEGEGDLRVGVFGALETEGRVPASQLEAQLPATERFSRAWPTMFADFGQMIGTMTDNVDNYQAVDALPPFTLFPWFFVVPGLLIAGSGFAARPSDHSALRRSQEEP